MSDFDLHKSARKLISSGADGLDDEALNKLAQTIFDAQRRRKKESGQFTNKDVEYLHEYSSLCEKVYEGYLDYNDAQEQLKVLNARFLDCISENIKKDRVLSEHEAEPETWYNSYY